MSNSRKPKATMKMKFKPVWICDNCELPIKKCSGCFGFVRDELTGEVKANAIRKR